MEKPDVERMMNDLENVFSSDPDMGLSTAALCISVPSDGRDVKADLNHVIGCLARHLLKESAQQYVDRHAGLLESLVAAYDRASGDRFTVDLCAAVTPSVKDVTEPWKLESLCELVRDTFMREGLRRPLETGGSVAAFADTVLERLREIDPEMNVPRAVRISKELTYLSNRPHRWTD